MKINRRDFLKMAGIAVFCPKGFLKVETELEKKFDFVRTYVKNKVFAVPKSEKIYLEYYDIKQTTQKPLLRILNWENDLKYVYLPLDEIRYSDSPLPRHHVEFESEQPLDRGDLIIINNWDVKQYKEYIVVELIPIFETFEMQNAKDKA